MYFTRRLPEFVHHKYSDDPEKKAEALAALEAEGVWFVPQQNKTGTNPNFGTMIVSDEHLRNAIGGQALDYLGQLPGQMQHLYALRI